MSTSSTMEGTTGPVDVWIQLYIGDRAEGQPCKIKAITAATDIYEFKNAVHGMFPNALKSFDVGSLLVYPVGTTVPVITDTVPIASRATVPIVSDNETLIVVAPLPPQQQQPQPTTGDMSGLQSEMQAMRLEIHGVRETMPSVLVGHVITPSGASRVPQVTCTVFDGLGLSLSPIRDPQSYTLPPGLPPQWEFSWQWSMAKTKTGTVDDRILERESYQPVLRYLRGLDLYSEDVSEGQCCVEKILFNADVYTRRNENPMLVRGQNVYLRHRVKGRTDIVALNRDRNGGNIPRNMIKFAIEIKTVAGYQQSKTGCMSEAQLQLIGLNAFNTNCSPPVVLTNLARTHEVVYLAVDEEWQYAIKVRKCDSFAAAVHFANDKGGEMCISHHFSRPSTPESSE